MAVHRSKIGWTDFSGGDANFVIGCTPVSEGCANCYAEAIIGGRQGRDFSQVRLYPEKLTRLRRVRFNDGGESFRRGPGSKPMVFVVDLGDLFHDDVTTAFIWAVLDTMWYRKDVTWQILTKRPRRALAFQQFFEAVYSTSPWSENIWLGFTGENQRRFDERAAPFEQISASVRFVSIEPALERVVLGDALDWLDWVIIGAESGPNRRDFDLDWARSGRDECAAAGVPFFYKQGSHLWPGRDDILDGQQWKQFPNG